MMSSPVLQRTVVVAAVILTYTWCRLASANPDAKRLYDDLLFQNDYNVLIRPVSNHKNNLTVEINLKLSALVDVVSFIRPLHSVVSLICPERDPTVWTRWHRAIIPTATIALLKVRASELG